MINVLIKEVDALYQYGLMALVTELFKNEGAENVNFLGGYEHNNIRQADIIIFSLKKGEHFTCFPELKHAYTGSMIGITDADVIPSYFLPICIRNMLFLKRDATVDSIRQTIRQAWISHTTLFETVTEKFCGGCKQKMLSLQELRVMAGFYHAQSATEIAKKMKLMPKTIYTHKYAVMHKFNLKSEHELLEFLNSLMEKRCNPNLFREEVESHMLSEH